MRAVVQLVSQASVIVEGKEVAAVGRGLLVLVGIGCDDTQADGDYIIKKLLNLRIFPDEDGKMNKSVQDVEGSLLLVSQFTLYANTQKGNRPSFTQAMYPEAAKELFEVFVQQCKSLYPKIQTGIFRAEMQVKLCNEGPVTILLEST